MTSRPTTDRPFLITGCGRSGTGWAAALFRALGHPCAHEKQFTWNKDGPLEVSESSWLAVPHMDSLPPDTPVLRIMRDPYRVVQSIIARGFLRHGDDPYDMYVEHHRPDITSASDHLGRAIRYTALWDEPLEGRNILRVDGNAHVITGAARYATRSLVSRSEVGQVRRGIGSRVNTNLAPMPAPSIRQIDAHPDAELLAARADRFGYGG